MPPAELMRGMDIAAYSRQQKEHLGQEAKSVKDFSVFDFDYVPEEPLLREEATLLIDELLRVDITGLPTHYAGIGSRSVNTGPTPVL